MKPIFLLSVLAAAICGILGVLAGLAWHNDVLCVLLIMIAFAAGVNAEQAWNYEEKL